MLIAYIVNDGHYDDCVLTDEYGNAEIQDNDELIQVIQTWIEDTIGDIPLYYKDGDIITTINVLDTETQKIEQMKMKAVHRPSFEIV